MRLSFIAGALMLLAGCKGEGERAGITVTHNGAVTVAQSTTEVRMGSADQPEPVTGSSTSKGSGKIIDNAGVVDVAELNGMSQELAELNRRGGPAVTMVLVRPTSGESMEQIGWALAGRPEGRALMLLADPDSGAVRIEGAVAPESKARVAAAMQQQLKAGQPAGALREAIAILKGAR